jgi:hypothetical protein
MDVKKALVYFFNQTPILLTIVNLYIFPLDILAIVDIYLCGRNSKIG